MTFVEFTKGLISFEIHARVMGSGKRSRTAF
jgi:hypothetical protein